MSLLSLPLLFNSGEGKLFAPGNLRATFDNPAYQRLINYYLGEKYTLRYTGGMVPDVFQILVKEKGVFTNVTSPTTKAKLRILFEVAPLALLVRGRWENDCRRPGCTLRVSLSVSLLPVLSSMHLPFSLSVSCASG